MNPLILMLIYGIVVGHGGNVYVLNEHLKPLSLMPSNELLTKSLEQGGNVVGISYLPNKRAYIVLKFEHDPASKAKIVYHVKKAVNPVKLKIYVSEDGKHWKLVGVEIAGMGNHSVHVKLGHATTTYVKLECVGALKPKPGASLIDYVGIELKSSLWDRIDAKGFKLYINKIWMSLPVLLTAYLSMTLGFFTILPRRFLSMLIAAVVYATILLLSLLFGANVSMPGSLSAFVLSCFLYGAIVGFILSKVLYQSARNTQD